MKNNKDGLDSSGYPLHLYQQESLIERVIELESAIKKHRDQKSDDRCWMDDQELYKVLNDGDLGDNAVGNKDQMLKNCERYLTNRCSNGKWKTYSELEEEIKQLQYEIYDLKLSSIRL